ncbi:MAG: hypothetical protein R3C14_48185 [Caldilineaceae bacterium]
MTLALFTLTALLLCVTYTLQYYTGRRWPVALWGGMIAFVVVTEAELWSGAPSNVIINLLCLLIVFCVGLLYRIGNIVLSHLIYYEQPKAQPVPVLHSSIHQ